MPGKLDFNGDKISKKIVWLQKRCGFTRDMDFRFPRKNDKNKTKQT